MRWAFSIPSRRSALTGSRAWQARCLKCRLALVSLIDRDRQWLKSCHGCPAQETSREMSFCAHAIVDRAVMVVPDALLDARFADNPQVTGAPHIRFYAGCPLVLPSGHCVGTLCIVDTRAHQLDDAQIRLLQDLGHLVEQELCKNMPAAVAS